MSAQSLVLWIVGVLCVAITIVTFVAVATS